MTFTDESYGNNSKSIKGDKRNNDKIMCLSRTVSSASLYYIVPMVYTSILTGKNGRLNSWESLERLVHGEHVS